MLWLLKTLCLRQMPVLQGIWQSVCLPVRNFAKNRRFWNSLTDGSWRSRTENLQECNSSVTVFTVYKCKRPHPLPTSHAILTLFISDNVTDQLLMMMMMTIMTCFIIIITFILGNKAHMTEKTHNEIKQKKYTPWHKT